MPNLRGTDPLVPKNLQDAMKLVKWRRQQSKAKAALAEAKAAKAALAEALKRPTPDPVPLAKAPQKTYVTPPNAPWPEDGPIAPKPKRST